MRLFATAAAFSITLNAFSAPAEPINRYVNLQVLPADTSSTELGEIMVGYLRSLGLPRLAGKGCLHCHVGDLETPRSQWDFASDDKPMKNTARTMIKMTQAINTEHLSRLDSRTDPSFEVSCTSCHSGRTDPRPLPTILWETYEDAGTEATATKFRTLHARYYGAGAYDFRARTLANLAIQMADAGNMEDAVTLARLNIEYNPDSLSVQRAALALELEHLINTNNVEHALVELARRESSLPAGVAGPGLLDSLGWRLIRSGREDAGNALIKANFAKHQSEYVPNESMAFTLFDSGHKEQAFAILEKWLEDNPDHARARRMLINLRKE